LEEEVKYPSHAFLHIPKTAGSSIIDELVKTDWVILGHDLRAENFVHLSDFRVHYAMDLVKVICCVRNPYDRLVSAYHYLKKGGNNPEDAKDAEKYLSAYDSFEDFVLRGLDEKNREFTQEQIHFKPQVFWCKVNNKSMVNKVFYFEKLDRLFKYICKHTDIEPNAFEVTNKSVHKPYMEYYNKEMKKTVYRAYKEDFKRFGYWRKFIF